LSFDFFIFLIVIIQEKEKCELSFVWVKFGGDISKELSQQSTK